MLSLSQQKAVETFENFLQDPTESEMVITGAAGTGKTYLVKHLKEVNKNILTLSLALDKKSGWRTVYTATTNKAAKVLSNTLNEEVITIHSLLGLQVKNNYKNGKVDLVTTYRTKVLGKTLIFIDESSMISQQLLGIIRQLSEKEKTKIVYIGDMYQLAAVGEGNSPVFKFPRNVVCLTEIQRQIAGSPIIQAAHAYKDVLEQGIGEYWPELTNAPRALQKVSGEEFEQVINQEFLGDYEPEDLRILAWTNEKVIAYNKHVRSLWTPNLDFQEGEKVITNNPITIMFKHNILAPVDSLITIEHIEQTIKNKLIGEGTIEGFSVSFKEIPYIWFLPKNQSDVAQQLKEAAKIKDWSSYFTIKNEWLDLRASYAQTVHKAQGSTYKKVFIDVGDIGQNKKWQEVARLMYVAISRASEEVYLYGSLPNRKWSK